MKTIKQIFIISMMMIFISILVIGCQQNPTSADSRMTTEQGAASKDLKIINYNSELNGLKKVVTCTKWVTWQDGAELKLACKGDNSEAVKLVLKVLQHTISQDAELSISMDDAQLSGNFDMVFLPHGVTFSSPALLNIEAKNLDISGISPDEINIYYDNQETGQWEVMNSKEIIVKVDEGYIKIVDAELPHFSRYAIGLE